MSSSRSTSISSLSLSSSDLASFAFRSSLDLARARLSAAASSTTSAPASTGSSSSAAPVATKTTEPTPSGEITFGHSLSRTVARATAAPRPVSANSSIQPWSYELKHVSSTSLPRSLAARKQAASVRKGTRPSLASRARGALKGAAGRCFALRAGRGGDDSASRVGVRGRDITVVFNTGRRMESRDYDAYESGLARRKALKIRARDDGMSIEAWCRMEGIRY